MDQISEWIALIGVTLAGALTLSLRSIAFISRLRGRQVEAPLACPRTGRKVHCTLVYDGRAGAYVDVPRCSAFGRGARPSCDQDCRHLLNLGIPLRHEGTSEGLGGLPPLAKGSPS